MMSTPLSTHQPETHDTLFISGLTVETIIGVFDWEREVQQELRFDVELGLSLAAAAASDQVTDALSYVDVADQITKVSKACKARLVEHLAEEISTTLFARWPIETLRLRITKPTAIGNAAGVGVEIFRQR